MNTGLNYRLLNESEIVREWAPTLTQAGITDQYKVSWVSKMCHYNSLNESFGTSGATFATQANTVGIGSVTPAPAPNGIAAFFNGGVGSADRYPNLLPLAVQIANKTIAFDLVNVIPMQTPAGQVAYADFVYADGNLTTSNRATLIKVPGLTGTFTDGTTYFALSQAGTGTGAISTPANADTALTLRFIGRSMIDGGHIFEVGDVVTRNNAAAGSGVWTAQPTSTVSVASVFDGNAFIIAATGTAPFAPAETGAVYTAVGAQVTSRVSLVRAIEDHIQGYTGSGRSNQDPFKGPFSNGTSLTSGMSRGTAEQTYPAMLGFQVTTKFVDTVEHQVGAQVTRQQMYDLQKIHGIDVTTMLENALANELSQTISKEILEHLFALGWTSNKQVFDTQGNYTLNVSVVETATTATSKTYVDKTGALVTVPVPAFVQYGGFENQSTLQQRILSKISMASNLITQRNRNRGGATFIVTNVQIASALQANAAYTFSPIENKLSQQSGSLYAMGTILGGVTVYVDPNMSITDNRVLVGRRGADIEPGLKFLPYAMAESVSIIAEQTMAPKIILSSRYALVPFGQWPEANYYTFFVNVDTGSII